MSLCLSDDEACWEMSAMGDLEDSDDSDSEHFAPSTPPELQLTDSYQTSRMEGGQLGDVTSYSWDEAADGTVFADHSMDQPFLVSAASEQGWPAMRDWQRLGELQSALGPRDVTAHSAIDNRQFQDRAAANVPHKRTVPAREALAQVFDPKAPRLYLKLGMSPGLREAIPALADRPFGPQSASRLRETLVKLWIGSQGNVTPLHFDLCHGCLAQVIGRKRVWLFPPSASGSLYPNSASSGVSVRTSRVDIPLWMDGGIEQQQLFPMVSNAASVGKVCIVEPGQFLYIPPFWWHCVLALEPNVSVLMPFDLTQEEQATTERPWTQPEWGVI